MIIDRLGGIDPLKDIQNNYKTPAKQHVKSGHDSISISNEAREMAEAYYLSSIAAETPDVRADRIAHRQAVAGRIRSAVVQRLLQIF